LRAWAERQGEDIGAARWSGFFPMSFAEAVRAASQWQMMDPKYSKRVRRCFMNLEPLDLVAKEAV